MFFILIPLTYAISAQERNLYMLLGVRQAASKMTGNERL
jgi:hypothetical protein